MMDFVDQESRLGMEPFPRRVTTRLMSTLASSLMRSRPATLVRSWRESNRG